MMFVALAELVVACVTKATANPSAYEDYVKSQVKSKIEQKRECAIRMS